MLELRTRLRQAACSPTYVVAVRHSSLSGSAPRSRSPPSLWPTRWPSDRCRASVIAGPIRVEWMPGRGDQRGSPSWSPGSQSFSALAVAR